jgi:hypothetical protein
VSNFYVQNSVEENFATFFRKKNSANFYSTFNFVPYLSKLALEVMRLGSCTSARYGSSFLFTCVRIREVPSGLIKEFANRNLCTKFNGIFT